MIITLILLVEQFTIYLKVELGTNIISCYFNERDIFYTMSAVKSFHFRSEKIERNKILNLKPINQDKKKRYVILKKMILVKSRLQF